VLENNRWKIEGRSGAAAHLGLKPSTLRFRMKKLDIKRPSH
jgi:formate hydrogenlyase transcriptional activator